ncbi:MAG TPA: transposase [Burkholderiaceae bacterium]|nr:transposase [Burkholderiaceae bacterium]
MSSRNAYRRHSAQFKLQLCQEIRSGGLARRSAQERYNVSANLIQHWLSLYDRGELAGDEAEAATAAAYEAKIAVLERKVGQLTMELDLLKKTPQLRLVGSSENSSIISGPMAAPSEGDAK